VIATSDIVPMFAIGQRYRRLWRLRRDAKGNIGKKQKTKKRLHRGVQKTNTAETSYGDFAIYNDGHDNDGD